MGLLLLALGYLSVAGSVARVVIKVDAARAHAIASSDGAILSDYSEDLFGSMPTTNSSSLPTDLARRAVLVEPTATKALTVLGFQAQLSGNTSKANRIFAYITQLSRRELRSQIWAIEQAVTRGDIADALRNYDIALRTSKDAPKFLFPPLTASLSEPLIRSELLKIFQTRPVWQPSFFDYASSSTSEPVGMIKLFEEGRRFDLEVSDNQRIALIAALISNDQWEEAWNFYRTFRPDARREHLRDPEFTLQTDNRSAFDWLVDTNTPLSVAILQDESGGMLDFAVPPSVGGQIVSQIQLLPAGVYRLQGQSQGLVGASASLPYWKLACYDGRELGRINLANTIKASGAFSGQLTVPADCSVQRLSLVARPTDDIMGIKGQILRVQMERLQ